MFKRTSLFLVFTILVTTLLPGTISIAEGSNEEDYQVEEEILEEEILEELEEDDLQKGEKELKTEENLEEELEKPEETENEKDHMEDLLNGEVYVETEEEFQWVLKNAEKYEGEKLVINILKDIYFDKQIDISQINGPSGDSMKDPIIGNIPDNVKELVIRSDNKSALISSKDNREMIFIKGGYHLRDEIDMTFDNIKIINESDDEDMWQMGMFITRAGGSNASTYPLGKFTFINSEISNFTKGGINIANMEVDIANSKFENNIIRYGNGTNTEPEFGYIEAFLPASYSGGGIYINNPIRSISIRDSEFYNNRATEYDSYAPMAGEGGAIAINDALDQKDIDYMDIELIGLKFKDNFGYNGSDILGRFVRRLGIHVKPVVNIKMEDNEHLGNENTRKELPEGKEDSMYGGAIYITGKYYEGIEEGDTVELDNVIVDGYTGFLGGGALFSQLDEVKVFNSKFIENSTDTEGGHAGGLYTEKTLKVEVDNLEAYKNKTRGYGGGVCFQETEDLRLTNSRFYENESIESLGGAVYIPNLKSQYLRNLDIYNNKADSGGGIYTWGSGNSSYRDLKFTGNEARVGGGLVINGRKNFDLNNILIEGNKAKYGGGAYFTNSEIDTDEDINFINNEGEYGGGIYFDNIKNYIDIKEDAKYNFKGNKAIDGGGIYIEEIKNREGSLLIGKLENKLAKDKKLYIDDSVLFTGNKAETYYSLTREDKEFFHLNPESKYLVTTKEHSNILNSPEMADTSLSNYDINYYNDETEQELIDYEIKYNSNGGKGEVPVDEYRYLKGMSAKVLGKGNLTREGYTFKGWNTEKDGKGITYKLNDLIEMKRDIVLYAKWDKKPTSGGGGGGNRPDTETEEPDKEPEIDLEEKPDIDPDTDPEEDIDYMLNTDDHFAYIQGYPDKTIRPENNITREEVSAVFFRLLNEDYRETIRKSTHNFPDFEKDRWSSKHIGTLVEGKILEGYEDGEFKPRKSITRGEVATIASRFAVLEEKTTSKFTDIEGHWAEKYIDSAVEKGWIEGYPDGTFKPDAEITRCEFVTLVNNVLNRKVDKENILDGIEKYLDLKEGTWYYEGMVEASNSHNYEEKRLENGSGVWTEIIYPDIEM